MSHGGRQWLGCPGRCPTGGRTDIFFNGSHIAWSVPAGFTVDFAGKGEWKITLDVFRDLGLAFVAAMIAIYVLLVAQTGSFAVPLVVMLVIPLTILGVMPAMRLEVKGETVLADEQGGSTQDFLMINHPVFFARNVKDFLRIERGPDRMARVLVFPAWIRTINK